MRAVQATRRHHLNQSTKNTTLVSREVREILRARLGNEYELYQFIVQQLRYQVRECQEVY